MSGKYLGDTFDIHGGGIDLRFPHHENELAQSAGAGRGFARVWMHNAWVTMAGEKMSKSLGNTALVSEVTKAFDPRAVRFFLLAPHYRSQIEFSPADEQTRGSLAEAEKGIERIASFLASAGERGLTRGRVGGPFWEAFEAAMNDDLATPTAVATLFEAVRAGNKALSDGDPGAADLYATVAEMTSILGINPADAPWATATGGDDLTPVVDRLVSTLLEQRSEARAAKDWGRADAIRDTLTEAGLSITDTPEGARWSLEKK